MITSHRLNFYNLECERNSILVQGERKSTLDAMSDNHDGGKL